MDIPRYDTSGFDPVAEYGFLQQNSVRETAPLHTHEFFEMFLVTDGKALHLVNDAVQNIEQGDLVLIRPEDRHCYDFYQSFDFRFVNVAFSVEALSAEAGLFLPDKPLEPLIRSSLPPIARLPEEDTRAAEAEFRKLDALMRSAAPEFARCYFRGLLAFWLCRYFVPPQYLGPRAGGKTAGKASAPPWLASAVTQMQSIENFRAGFPRLVELCRCSEEHLCREFKKYYKVTPVSFINTQRLGYSLYLLSNTKLEIIEIAEQCGFGNLSHFYHLFRDRFGVSPGRYRARQASGGPQTGGPQTGGPDNGPDNGPGGAVRDP